MNLDPRLPLDIVRDYVCERGYGALHCAASVDWKPPATPRKLDDLDRWGCMVVECMSARAASGLWECGLDDRPAVEVALEYALPPDVTDRICAHFRTSGFAPIAVHLTETKPGDESASFQWHCDAGPPDQFLKLLVYLNETDGATHVVRRAATQLFMQAGYGFGPLAERLDDINEIAHRSGFAWHEDWWTLSPPPGHAILFEPAKVLHKGVPPTAGVRHMLQIQMIPWGAPWHEFLAEQWEFVKGNEGAGFPNVRVNGGG